MTSIEEQIAAIDKETKDKLDEIHKKHNEQMRRHANACRILNLDMQNATPPPRTTIEQRRDSAKKYASQVRSRKPEMQVKKINQSN